jgi:hypothetical protein
MNDGTSENDIEGNGAGMKCDFCEDTVPSVRRVALDGEYERLRTPHAVMYSCPSCFETKEQRRVGLERSSGRG